MGGNVHINSSIEDTTEVRKCCERLGRMALAHEAEEESCRNVGTICQQRRCLQSKDGDFGCYSLHSALSSQLVQPNILSGQKELTSRNLRYAVHRHCEIIVDDGWADAQNQIEL